MIDHQETTSQQPPNGNRLPDILTLPAPEPAVSPFVSRIQELKAASQVSLQRVNSLLSVGTVIPPSEETEDSQVDVPGLLHEVTEENGLSSEEYLQKSRHALEESARLKQQIDSEQQGLIYSRNQRHNEEEQLKQKIEELNRVKGLRRIFVSRDRRRLNNEKEVLQQEIKEIKDQLQVKVTQFDQLQKQEELIRQRQEELVLTETCREVQTIKSGYEQLFQDLLEDDSLPSELRETYFKFVLDPRMEEETIPAEKKERFHRVFNTYFNHRDDPDKERKLYGDKFISLSAQLGFGDIRDQYFPLIQGIDRETVKQLVATLAAEDISPIRNAAFSHFKGWSADEFSRNFYSAIGTNPTDQVGGRENYSFGVHIYRELLWPRSNRDPFSESPNMDFWQAVRSSPKVNQIFGEIIKSRDDEYRQIVLDKSLSDNQKGVYVDLLRHFPTPEAIRNLVILASNNDLGKIGQAGQSLHLLSLRPDWKNILDEAEKTYPALREARQALESRRDVACWGTPDNLQETAQNFVLDIFDGSSVDERLSTLAIKAMTTNSRLTVLANRGIIPENEATVIKNASNLINQARAEHVKGNTLSDNFLLDQNFNTVLKWGIYELLLPKPGYRPEFGLETVKLFATLSQEILNNKGNYAVLKYLTNSGLIGKLEHQSIGQDMLPTLLTAYQRCPVLLTNNGLSVEFCDKFDGKQSIDFFENMSAAYKGLEKPLTLVFILVSKGALTKERALELPSKAREILTMEDPEHYPDLSLAFEFPQLFLATDDGLDFLAQVRNLFSLEKGLGERIGKRIIDLKREGQLDFPKLLKKITFDEIEQIDKLLATGGSISEIQQMGWQQLLMGYVRSLADIPELPELSPVSAGTIKLLFEKPEVRDLCLSGLNNVWLDYLKSDKPGEVPFSLIFMSDFINHCGGAGVLSQVESLSSLIRSVNLAFSRETTVERTKHEIYQGLAKTEDRFAKERWSNEEKTDFYNVSRDIIGAAPSLFSDYLNLFEKMGPSKLKLFAKEIYPLYRTKLVLIENRDNLGNKIYDIKQLIQIRKDIRSFSETFNTEEKSFELQKQKLIEEIKSQFKDRFGIIKIPQEFSSEHLRSIPNVSIYLANLHRRDPGKETILGFYLSLMINNRWDDFRSGQTIDASEYITPEKSYVINGLLRERQRLSPLTPENLGISENEIPEFLKLLQQETQNLVVGNIETIDIKLTNVILNLSGLEDLDLYPDPLDKKRMQLLQNWGNKKVGSVAARMYQSLANPGRSIQFSEDDEKVRQQITQAIQELGLDLSPQTLKEHFQDGIKPLAAVVNLLSFIEDIQAPSEVGLLRELLNPSYEVIEIFKRMGEDFRPTSGAMALSLDLNFLDNLIVKREDELSKEETVLLKKYTTNIRERILKLENIHEQIRNKFISLKLGSTDQNKPLLKEKLDQVEKIINAQTTQQVISSSATNNLNVIIENIRECLSCIREGCNNDTDLTFGDINKFYLYSQTETQSKGSISDQIVFVEPITRADGSQEVAFVLDKLYGATTPAISENQREVVLKKLRAIKQRFPGIKLSIFISDIAVVTGGAPYDMLLETFKSQNISAKEETVEVDVAQSSTGDHYIEFGGGGRTIGKRQVEGIVLSL